LWEQNTGARSVWLDKYPFLLPVPDEVRGRKSAALVVTENYHGLDIVGALLISIQVFQAILFVAQLVRVTEVGIAGQV